MTTGRQVRSGLKWVSLSLVVTQAVRFGATVVLARLLVPEMFGLIAMANATIELIAVIRELGFGAAYIQRQDSDPEAAALTAATAFWLLVAINGILFCFAMLLAPWLAAIFAGDGLELILRVMFAAFLIDALGTLPAFMLQKRLWFGRHAAAEVAAALAYAVVAVGLAWRGFGVWSLVAGHLSSRAVQAAVAFAASGWRPSLRFSPRVARELFEFGKYLWAFAVISAIGRNVDRVIVGRYLGAASLGIYGMAFHLCRLPSNHISRLVNRITFPALARVQDDPDALRRAFCKTLRHVSMLSVPVACGLLAVAEDFVLTVYGDKWADAVPVVGVLAFFGMALSLSSITGPVFQAIGQPRILLYTSVVHQLLLGVLLYALAPYGVLGVSYGVLAPLLLSSAIAYVLVAQRLDIPWTELAGPLLRTGVSGFGMWAAVRALRVLLVAQVDWPRPLLLGVEVVFGGLCYLLLSALCNRSALLEFVTTGREVVGVRRPSTAGGAS